MATTSETPSGPPEPVTTGRYYEDIGIGQVDQTPGRTITQADIVFFAGVTGDFSEVHLNEPAMRGSRFGRPIAHGLLGLCFAQGQVQRMGWTQGVGIAALGFTEWQFKRPITVGDTIYVRVRCVAKRRSRSTPGAGIVVDRWDVINQEGAVLQTGEHVRMVRCRDTASNI